jgi:hypothetical protein
LNRDLEGENGEEDAALLIGTARAQNGQGLKSIEEGEGIEARRVSGEIFG